MRVLSFSLSAQSNLHNSTSHPFLWRQW